MNDSKKPKESKNLKEYILNNVNDCIFATNGEGIITFWGKGAERILGFNEAEKLGTNAKDLFGLKKSDFLKFVNESCVEKKYKSSEIDINNKNKKLLTFNVNISKINNEEQIHTSYIYVCQDITFQKKEKLKLNSAQEQTELVLNNINQEIYISDPESMDVLFANTPMQENFSNIEQTNCFKAIFNKSKPCEFCNVGKLTRSNELIELNNEVYIEKAKKWYKIHEKKIPWMNNKQAIIHTFTDISEIKKAEKEQTKLIDQLSYLSNSATKFISLNTFDEIYRYLGRSINKALEGSMVVVGEFNNEDFTIIDFFGLDEKFAHQFEKITGRKGISNTFKPGKERLDLYRTGHLEKIGNLNNMFMNYFDEETRKKICNLADIKDTRIIGVTYDKKLFAGISLILTKPIDTIDIEFTQALVYQASIAIQRKNNENKLLHTLEKAEAANKAKSAFLTNISHEIRTPLNTIIGFTEILSNLNEDPLKESYINSIASSGKNLLMIINDILDLSKIESGTMQINKMAISIKSLFEDIEYTFRKVAEKKDLEFFLSIDDDVPDMIQMDQPRLRQVLHNLVSNAIKFTTEGKVTVSAKAINNIQTSTITFSIKDTGIGINKKEIENILKPFSQEDSRDSRKYEGIGMGLSIAQKITKMLGGKLKIESESGKGSLFQVELNNVAITIDKDEKEPAINYKFNKEKVLIIEEDMSQLEIIQSAIDKHNLIAFAAESGEQGFAFAFEFNPDFIVINLNDNNENAIQTAKNIKSIEQFKTTPIIGISSTPTKESENYTFFDSIISPPITEEKLISALCKFIGDKEERSDDSSAKNFDFLITDLSILNELSKELEKKITPLCNELKQRQPLNKVKELNKRLQFISQKYKSKIIENYYIKIDNSIKSFDIENMRELINDYTKLIESLKNKIKNK